MPSTGAVAGTGMVRAMPSSPVMTISVGTECRSSSSHDMVRLPPSIGAGCATVSVAPATLSNGVCQAVVGSPSNAAAPRDPGLPRRRRSAITSNGSSKRSAEGLLGCTADTRASPVSANGRASGTVNSRTRVGSAGDSFGGGRIDALAGEHIGDALVGEFVGVDDVEGVEARDPHDAIVTYPVDRDLRETDSRAGCE